MLSVVEALKEFRTIVHGHPIDVCTDHKNWACDKKLTNARVMRWRLLIDEYAPNIIYLPGEHNVVADALSRLQSTPLPAKAIDEAFVMVAECFDVS